MIPLLNGPLDGGHVDDLCGPELRYMVPVAVNEKDRPLACKTAVYRLAVQSDQSNRTVYLWSGWECQDSKQ